MATVVSIFNNKGGDFDPQCNLSIAVMGESIFVQKLPTQNVPYGTTVRAFLQRFLQNTGGEEIFLHKRASYQPERRPACRRFWLNVYADTLNVGSDLLAGTGLSRYVSIRKIISKAEESANTRFDFVLVDLPPSFGSLVRAALYSSDYYIVPCTSQFQRLLRRTHRANGAQFREGLAKWP
jgi:chromosome partitioning protein